MYHQALFCGWLSALVARELFMNEKAIGTAYMAGLLHDIGLLHVPPSVVQKNNESLTPEEWRAVQCHVVVSKLLLETAGYAKTLLPKAVFEHHESCDGTGYPLGKSGTDLEPLGQIVALVDSLHAVLFNQLKPRDRNLGDVLPFLHLNAYTHYYHVYQAMHSVVKKARIPNTFRLETDEVPKYSAKLLERGYCLQRTINEMDGAAHILKRFLDNTEFQLVLSVMQRVLVMVISSGMVRQELLDWLGLMASPLSHTALEEDDFAQLSDIELMQNELMWQIGNVVRRLESTMIEHPITQQSNASQISHMIVNVKFFLAKGRDAL
jgi:hypothetical protein